MKTLYLYEIKKTLWKFNKKNKRTEGKDCHEFIGAENLNQVMMWLSLDLQDEGVQIKSIIQHVPILSILREQVKPTETQPTTEGQIKP